MSKSIKFKDNTYLDSTSIVHNKVLLSEILNKKNCEIVCEFTTTTDGNSNIPASVLSDLKNGTNYRIEIDGTTTSESFLSFRFKTTSNYSNIQTTDGTNVNNYVYSNWWGAFYGYSCGNGTPFKAIIELSLMDNNNYAFISHSYSIDTNTNKQIVSHSGGYLEGYSDITNLNFFNLGAGTKFKIIKK